MAQHKYNTPLETALQPLSERLERDLIKNGYEHDEVKGFGFDILSGVIQEILERTDTDYLIHRAKEHADELGITQYEN